MVVQFSNASLAIYFGLLGTNILVKDVQPKNACLGILFMIDLNVIEINVEHPQKDLLHHSR